ncbi:cytochrome c oxidase subunit II [Paenibacillus sp. MBLB4367]|uniref:cytochrome c oxidase subunit II n=1 Tax=Paenibacillus sp. MBLB4367 TaxID=3384767 RepID=UPI0039082FB6
MSRWKFVWRLMPLFAVLALVLTGCGDPTLSTLDPKGPVADEQRNLMMISFGIMLFVLAAVFLIYIYVIIRFRQRKGQTGIPKQVEGSHVLEIIWTVVPIILLVILAVPTVYYTFKHSQDYTQDKDSLHVKVTGHQFWWQFEYPDQGINTAQDLYIPVGKKVAFELTTADVNHSFWVPSLGGKIDTNPGEKNVNVLYLQADEPGEYKGKCAELCGASHALMDFKVVAVSEAEFNQWVSKMTAPKTVSADAAKGEQVFKDNCLSCHAVNAAGAGLGPNLNGFANRTRVAGFLPHDDQSLKDWINDPQAVKPGSKMPAVGLNEAQVNDVVKYLNSLK